MKHGPKSDTRNIQNGQIKCDATFNRKDRGKSPFLLTPNFWYLWWRITSFVLLGLLLSEVQDTM